MATANVWKWSRIGLGTRRLGDLSQSTIVRHAFENAGINVLDTSAFFSAGENEIVLGKILKHLEPNIKRQDFHIISKAGFLSQQNLEKYKDIKEIPGVFKPDFPKKPKNEKKENEKEEDEEDDDEEDAEETPAFSLDPKVVGDELQLSLKRLQTNYLDSYLVANPEWLWVSLFSTMENTFPSPQKVESVLDDTFHRIEKCFEMLEQQVSQGTIKSYGISCDMFRSNVPKEFQFPYERVLETAHKVAKSLGKSRHSFQTVQFPANLAETNALEVLGNWCYKHGLYSIVQRPLTAITMVSDSKGRQGMDINRLAIYPPLDEDKQAIRDMKRFLKDPELKSLKNTILPFVEAVMEGEITNIFDLRAMIEEDLLTTLDSMIRGLSPEKGKELGFHLSGLVSALEQHVSHLGNQVIIKTLQEHKMLDETKIDLDPFSAKIPYENLTEGQKQGTEKIPLSRYALDFLLNKQTLSPPVSCVLVGATVPSHLADLEYFYRRDHPEFVPAPFKVIDEEEFRKLYGQDPESVGAFPFMNSSYSASDEPFSSPSTMDSKPATTPKTNTTTTTPPKDSDKAQKIKDALEGLPPEIIKLGTNAVLKKKRGETPTEEEEKARKVMYARYQKQMSATAANEKATPSAASSSAASSTENLTMQQLVKMIEDTKGDQKKQMELIKKLKPEQIMKLKGHLEKLFKK